MSYILCQPGCLARRRLVLLGMHGKSGSPEGRARSCEHCRYDCTDLQTAAAVTGYIRAGKLAWCPAVQVVNDLLSSGHRCMCHIRSVRVAELACGMQLKGLRGEPEALWLPLILHCPARGEGQRLRAGVRDVGCGGDLFAAATGCGREQQVAAVNPLAVTLTAS